MDTLTEANALYNEKNPYRGGALAALGGTCDLCGNDDFRVLEISRLDGTAQGEMNTRDREVYYQEIVSGLHQVRVSCANCRKIRAFDKKYVDAA